MPLTHLYCGHLVGLLREDRDKDKVVPMYQGLVMLKGTTFGGMFCEKCFRTIESSEAPSPHRSQAN
jgi:hypothetical protein